MGILLFTALHPLSTAWAGPLHDAVASEDLNKAQQLISQGTDINAKDQRGQSPLLPAAYGRSYKIVQLLIEKGTDLNIKNDYGQTPFLIALYRGDTLQ